VQKLFTRNHFTNLQTKANHKNSKDFMDNGDQIHKMPKYTL